MPYCTQSDILRKLDEARLVQLTDDEGLGQVNAGRVEQAIADADALIDGYVGSRHAVPLSPVPAIIKTYSVAIAVYFLYGRRDRVPESRAQDYQDAVRFLELVAAGKVSLGAEDPEGSPPSAMRPEFSVENPERAFTRAAMKGF